MCQTIKKFDNITEEFLKANFCEMAKFKLLTRYKENGVIYYVDNVNVCINKPDISEIGIYNSLVNNYSFNVRVIPEFKGIYNHKRAADCFINGYKFEIKSCYDKVRSCYSKITTKSPEKYFCNKVKKAKTQSNNFILNYTNTGFNKEIMMGQIEKIYRDIGTSFVDIIMIMENGLILNIFRKR